ncbi:MAG: ATP-dependent DNA helicase RecG [Acidimicrobiia bacterium]
MNVANPSPLTLAELAAKPVSVLKGVGDKRAAGLADMGIANVLDLITHYPRRYVDRTNEARIRDLVAGEEATVLVTVRSVNKRTTANRRTMVTVEVGDASGRLSLVFFNQPWREKQLKPGLSIALFGKADVYRGGLQMTNPVVDLIGDRTSRIVPMYPQSEKAGLFTWDLAGFVEEALNRCRPRGLADPLPVDVLDRLDMVDRDHAVRAIHLPESMAEAMAARKRLVFDELLRVQLALVLRKRAIEAGRQGIEHAVGGELVRRFHAALPFPLTGAQARAISEIDADLASPIPMHRLLQGDVGSGKTVVAVTTLLSAVEGGHQGALMAPTEVLAEQHFAGMRALLADLSVPDPGSIFGDRPLSVALLTNRVTGPERRRVMEGLADGSIDLVVGTHALIQDAVEFRSLGAVVVDEQHRFGVEQRAALRAKSGVGQITVPDVLVMTATPIPRTAAMTVYGDLDVSVLDELPPGRTPIVTHWVQGPLAEEAMWAHVREQIDEGRQVYVVCPLIEESEKLEVASAQETYERLSNVELRGLQLGLLHGRMSSAEKDLVMGRFRSGELHALVATTVIEVGVDVPNATVMVIVDADRFGIAQLHQLRGRVGRGRHASFCYLLGGEEGEPSPRLEALVASTDGFELAEVDLELRGEGTLMSSGQSGRSDLKLASLRRDKKWVAVAREVAFELVDRALVSEGSLLAEELSMLIADDEREYLFKN